MKKYRMILYLIITCILASMLPIGTVLADSEPWAGLREYYVAPNGSAENPGTKDAPFARLEQARDAIRAAKKHSDLPQGGIRVYLREGTYLLDQTFQLNREDSGTADCPITYMVYPGEKAVLSGGYTLDGTKFASVADKEALAAIPKSAQKKAVVFDLASVGITEFEPVKSFGWGYPEIPPEMQLYVEGEIQTVARYPNDTTLKTGAVKEKGLVNDVPKAQYDETFYTTSGGSFYYDDEQLDRLAGVPGLLAWGYWQSGDWSTNDILVRSIDPSEHLLVLDGPTAFGLNSDKDFYVYNALQLLDHPGEYYIDREHAKLYLIPQTELKSAQIQLNKATYDLVFLQDASNIILSGLDLTLTLKNAITIQNGSDNLVRGCRIYQVGKNGVNLYGDSNKTDLNNGVVGSELYEIGETAIDISAGNRKFLKPGNCFAINNRIHDFGQVVKTYRGAVNLNGCGNSARYNEVYDAPHLAFNVSGNDQAVEYNHIYRVSKQSNDTGAIYSYGQNSYLGYQFNGNYFHDIHSTAEIGAGIMAIYLDSHICGTTILHNYIDNVNNTGIFVKARYNTVKYNIIKDSSRGLYLSDYDFGRQDYAEQLYRENEQNGFYTELWNKHYPYWPEVYSMENGADPAGNEVVSNVLINAGEVAESGFLSGDNQVYNFKMSLEDVAFEDYQGGNLNLKEQSRVYSAIADFPRFDFGRIGLYSRRFDAAHQNQVSLKVGSPSAIAHGEQTMVDPDNCSVMPVILEGRTLVPARFIAQGFGAEVLWDADTATAEIILEGKTIRMTLGSGEMLVDGTPVALEVPAQSIQGRTMVPLRALVEALGKQVYWEQRGLISIGESDHPFEFAPELVDALYYLLR